MSNPALGRQGWRQVGETAQPLEAQAEQWVVVWLTKVLEGMAGISPDAERVTDAVVAAVNRAGARRSTLAGTRQPLRVRVLMSGTLADASAARAWSFFLLERAAGELDGPVAAPDCEQQSLGHCIELYLYTECGAA